MVASGGARIQIQIPISVSMLSATKLHCLISTEKKKCSLSSKSKSLKVKKQRELEDCIELNAKLRVLKESGLGYEDPNCQEQAVWARQG